MRKMKQLLKMILTLALVVTLLPIYNVSAARSNLRLGEETKTQIQADYLKVHKAANPDKCMKHEETFIDEFPATAFSQGYTGRAVCEKCYTVLQDGRWIPTLAHTRFDDTKTSYWYCKSIDYCDKKGIMVGIDENHFEPERTITRGECITALHRLAGTPTVSKVSTFTDVAADSFYAEAIAWGVETGIVYGMTETTYLPNQPITREDMACLVARYAKAVDAEFLYDDDMLPLPDVGISDLSVYAIDSYRIVYSEGIMSGHADGLFYPKQNTTRAEVATVFMNLLEKMNGPAQAYLQVGSGEDAWVSHLEEQEADLFRSILDKDTGIWREAPSCECIGECQLILDDVRYWIDWEDYTHQIKYADLYGGISGAMETENTEVLNTLSEMLWMYKFVYELTK